MMHYADSKTNKNLFMRVSEILFLFVKYLIWKEEIPSLQNTKFAFINRVFDCIM